MKSRKPYRAGRWSGQAERSVLLPDEVGRIVSAGSNFAAVVRATKEGLPAATGIDTYRFVSEMLAASTHLERLADCGVRVRKVAAFARATRARLGVCNLHRDQRLLPVLFCFANGGEAGALFRAAAAQTLMLITGDRVCLESAITINAAGVIGHSAIERPYNMKLAKTILALTKAFWQGKAVVTGSLPAGDGPGAPVRLRGTRVLRLVSALDAGREERAELEADLAAFEAKVLIHMKGHRRAILKDGSELIVTPVHRDAHYVGPVNYTQLRHTGKE